MSWILLWKQYSKQVSKTKVQSSDGPELGQSVTLQLQFCSCRIFFIIIFSTDDFKQQHLLAKKSFGWLVWFIVTQANYSVHLNIFEKESSIYKIWGNTWFFFPLQTWKTYQLHVKTQRANGTNKSQAELPQFCSTSLRGWNNPLFLIGCSLLPFIRRCFPCEI